MPVGNQMIVGSKPIMAIMKLMLLLHIIFMQLLFLFLHFFLSPSCGLHILIPDNNGSLYYIVPSRCTDTKECYIHSEMGGSTTIYSLC